MHFVREHRTKVERMAAAPDSVNADVMESLTEFFTQVEVRRFQSSKHDVVLACVMSQLVLRASSEVDSE